MLRGGWPFLPILGVFVVIKLWLSNDSLLRRYMCIFNPPLTLEYLGGGLGQKFLRNIPPDHVEYAHPPQLFRAAKRRGGGVLRMPNFILDISGYIKWIYIDQKSTPRMTSANSYSWSLKILRNGILLLQWIFFGGASRAVKYHGFAPPPLKHFTN